MTFGLVVLHSVGALGALGVRSRRTPKRFSSLVPRVERDLPWSLSRPFCLSSKFNLPVDPYRTGEVCLAVVVWCLGCACVGNIRCYTHSAGRCCRAGHLASRSVLNGVCASGLFRCILCIWRAGIFVSRDDVFLFVLWQ